MIGERGSPCSKASTTARPILLAAQVGGTGQGVVATLGPAKTTNGTTTFNQADESYNPDPQADGPDQTLSSSATGSSIPSRSLFFSRCVNSPGSLGAFRSGSRSPFP